MKVNRSRRTQRPPSGLVSDHFSADLAGIDAGLSLTSVLLSSAMARVDNSKSHACNSRQRKVLSGQVIDIMAAEFAARKKEKQLCAFLLLSYNFYPFIQVLSSKIKLLTLKEELIEF